jgi:hypothetical protein
MIMLAHKLTGYLGKALFLLDRLYLTVPALRALDECNGVSGQVLHIVTKAKRNCVSFQEPETTAGKRGRPRKRGASVKMLELFAAEQELFSSARVLLYGKCEDVRYYCVDLLWGKGLYKKLRFVLVEYGHNRSVLVSTNLALAPLDIIRLYARRFSIEVMFREMKQTVCAFGYHFWSKYLPKLNRFRKKTDPEPVDQVITPYGQKRVRLAVKAIEGFVFCSIVVTGLLQLISMRFSGTKEFYGLRYLRTYRNSVVSEATAADFLRRHFLLLLLRQSELPLAQIIAAKQDPAADASKFNEAA